MATQQQLKCMLKVIAQVYYDRARMLHILSKKFSLRALSNGIDVSALTF
jgi:hypothetical protein